MLGLKSVKNWILDFEGIKIKMLKSCIMQDLVKRFEFSRKRGGIFENSRWPTLLGMARSLMTWTLNKYKLYKDDEVPNQNIIYDNTVFKGKDHTQWIHAKL